MNKFTVLFGLVMFLLIFGCGGPPNVETTHQDAEQVSEQDEMAVVIENESFSRIRVYAMQLSGVEIPVGTLFGAQTITTGVDCMVFRRGTIHWLLEVDRNEKVFTWRDPVPRSTTPYNYLLRGLSMTCGSRRGVHITIRDHRPSSKIISW